MTDEFLASLQADWTSQGDAAPVVLRRARRGRTLSFLMLAGELAAMVFGFAAGVWFALVALETGRLMFTMASIVLVAMSPAFALAVVLARRDALRWEAETPAGVLRARRRQVEGALRSIWLGWWATGVMIVFLTVLWSLELGGLMAERSFLITYTSICTVFMLATAVWLVVRRKHFMRQRDACDRMLAELGEG